MGRNVFVSYRYGDRDVRQFINSNHRTTSRDYVNVIENILKDTDMYYYNGEYDGEDLSDLDSKTIESILADKMFYTSITIVLITPRMFKNIKEIEQWIPWEISYSLQNKKRTNGNSNTNAILAVVIPDRKGSYRYAMYSNGENTFVKKKGFFEIILRNMFNRKNTDHYEDGYGNPMYVEGNSYIVLTKWDEFWKDPEYYLELALENRGQWEQFDIVKRINKTWVS